LNDLFDQVDSCLHFYGRLGLDDPPTCLGGDVTLDLDNASAARQQAMHCAVWVTALRLETGIDSVYHDIAGLENSGSCLRARVIEYRGEPFPRASVTLASPSLSSNLNATSKSSLVDNGPCWLIAKEKG
jgi:hypothetical protein